MLSGFMYSFIGISFKVGERGGIKPLQVMLFACMVGMVVFGIGSYGSFSKVSGWFYFWGLTTGLTQYAMMKLIKPTMKRGPLSPLWCAMMLAFVPAIVFAWVYLGEACTVWQILAMAAAAGAVVAAATQTHTTATASNKEKLRTRIVYVILLILLVLTNSEANMVNKGLQAMVPDFAAVTSVYLFLLYLGVVIPAALEIAIRRERPYRSKYFYWAGALAAMGTIGGLFFQNVAIAAPAALVFTVISATSILSSALMSVCFFGEKRTTGWYVTLAAALLAIGLSQGGALMDWLAAGKG